MAVADLSKGHFYGILDTGYVGEADLAAKCEALLEGGAAIVQLRAKSVAHARRVEYLNQLRPLCAAAGVTLVVNDDLEAALAFDDVGLHVGQEDMPVPLARKRLGRGRVLGLSNHTPGEVLQAVEWGRGGLLDYFAVGPVFATLTKPDYIPVGLALVSYAASLSPSIPWVAIGGIGAANSAKVAAAGASAVVAVSEVLKATDTVAAIGRIRQAFEERNIG